MISSVQKNTKTLAQCRFWNPRYGKPCNNRPNQPPPVHLQLPSFPGKPHRIWSCSTQCVSVLGTSQKSSKSSRNDNNNNDNNNNNNNQKKQPKKHRLFSSSMKHHLNHNLLEKFHPFCCHEVSIGPPQSPSPFGYTRVDFQTLEGFDSYRLKMGFCWWKKKGRKLNVEWKWLLYICNNM